MMQTGLGVVVRGESVVVVLALVWEGWVVVSGGLLHPAVAARAGLAHEEEGEARQLDLPKSKEMSSADRTQRYITPRHSH